LLNPLFKTVVFIVLGAIVYNPVPDDLPISDTFVLFIDYLLIYPLNTPLMLVEAISSIVFEDF
jgi:uncharacterized membrane protein YcaP (DUF421 family)